MPAHGRRNDHLTTSFNDFGLAEPILRAVTELGYRDPTRSRLRRFPWS